MINLIEDVSVLTNVPVPTLSKFVPVCNMCIGHSLYESLCKKELVSIVDLGFGELHLKIEDGGVRYKFIPSESLEKTVIQTVSNNSSPIMKRLEDNLQSKIDKSYKELL